MRTTPLLLGKLGCLGALWALLASGCSPVQSRLTCEGAEEAALDDYVTQKNCTGAVVIEILGSRPSSELWVLEEPPASSPAYVDQGLESAMLLDPTFVERSRALVQINGFTFECERDNCYSDPTELQFPVTRVFESTYPLSSNSTSHESCGPTACEEAMLAFGPRSSQGIAIHLGTKGLGVPPAFGGYNALGSIFDVMREGVCGEGTVRDDWTAIGYRRDAATGAADLIVMLHAPHSTPLELCELLQELGVTDAVRMDGGGSAGMFLNSENAIDGLKVIGSTTRRIPYRIGLVTLADVTVQNPGFESPNLLSEPPSGTPPGRHAFSGNQMEKLRWQGAAVLYRTELYNRWAQPRGRPTLPSHGEQLVAIRPRDEATDFVSQQVATPRNRYCMLHFFHGYHQPKGCTPDDSELTVSFHNSQGGSPTVPSIYTSAPTTGSGASLNEVWLRFLTPANEDFTQIKFTASHSTAEGNCEVLLEDVSVACAQ